MDVSEESGISAASRRRQRSRRSRRSRRSPCRLKPGMMWIQIVDI